MPPDGAVAFSGTQVSKLSVDRRCCDGLKTPSLLAVRQPRISPPLVTYTCTLVYLEDTLLRTHMTLVIITILVTPNRPSGYCLRYSPKPNFPFYAHISCLQAKVQGAGHQ